MEKHKYLKHPVSKRVLPWTQILSERGDMIPCDSKGNSLAEGRNAGAAVGGVRSAHALPHTVDLGDSNKRKQVEQQLDNEGKKANTENLHRKTLPYDGIMGVLPDWIPEREHPRFEEHRTRLLRDYSHVEGLEFLKLWPQYLKDGVGKLRVTDFDRRKKPIRNRGVRVDNSPFATMKTELWESIDYLVLLKNAVDSGPMNGLKMLVGENAARGYKVVSSGREGGKAKKINFSQEKEHIRKIAEQIINKRSRRPSNRHLALLVVSEAYPSLKGEDARKKADVIRHWLD